MPACTTAANGRIGTARYQFPYPQPSGVLWCVNGCSAYPDAIGSNVVGATLYAYALVSGPGLTGSNCASSGTTVPTPTTPLGTTTPVPCTTQQGAISDSTGKVVCVDPTTPGATAPPIQSTTTKKTTFGDGSTSTTTITNTCTGDGACSSGSTTTVTGAGGGGTAGQAGTPGTTTTTDDKQKKDTPTFCAENPNLQICKGGMSEEGTQKSVLAEIKKLTTAPTDTNFADGDDFDSPMEGVDGDAVQKLTDSYKSTTDALKFGFDDQNAPKSEPKFMEILGNWFEDVPQTGCEPPVFAVAGHALDLEAWCPTAEKISNIGAYALWFMTLVGLFVMVTGGKGNT